MRSSAKLRLWDNWVLERYAQLLIGTLDFLKTHKITIPPKLKTEGSTWQAQGATVSFIAVNGKNLGLVTITDPVKPTATQFEIIFKSLGYTPNSIP